MTSEGAEPARAREEKPPRDLDLASEAEQKHTSAHMVAWVQPRRGGIVTAGWCPYPHSEGLEVLLSLQLAGLSHCSSGPSTTKKARVGSFLFSLYLQQSTEYVVIYVTAKSKGRAVERKGGSASI